MLAALNFGRQRTSSATSMHALMTILANYLIAAILCAVLSAGAASPRVAELPPDVLGVHEDNDLRALNLSACTFAEPGPNMRRSHRCGSGGDRD
jgi:hypothetical protein